MYRLANFGKGRYYAARRSADEGPDDVVDVRGWKMHGFSVESDRALLGLSRAAGGLVALRPSQHPTRKLSVVVQPTTGEPPDATRKCPQTLVYYAARRSADF